MTEQILSLSIRLSLRLADLIDDDFTCRQATVVRTFPTPARASTADPSPPYANPLIAIHPVSSSYSVPISSTDNVPLGAEAQDIHMAESSDPYRVIWQRRYLPSQAVLQSLLQPIDQDEPSQAVLQNLQGPPQAPTCSDWPPQCDSVLRARQILIESKYNYLLTELSPARRHACNNAVLQNLRLSGEG